MSSIRIIHFHMAILAFAFSPMFLASAGASQCPAGEHWVRAHFRRAYIRADGIAVSAAHVSAHCHENPASYAAWAARLRSGLPPGWKSRGEQPIAWSEEERQRVLEALSYLPKELLVSSVEGLYRLRRSLLYAVNPAAGLGDNIALYDPAFDPKQNLARVLAHELAHKLYRQFTVADAKSYNSAAEWRVLKTPSGETFFLPMREHYVEEDGKEGPDEDFINNIEYFPFNPRMLRKLSPKVYDWIHLRYVDSFRLGRGH